MLKSEGVKKKDPNAFSVMKSINQSSEEVSERNEVSLTLVKDDSIQNMKETSHENELTQENLGEDAANIQLNSFDSSKMVNNIELAEAEKNEPTLG